MSNSLPHSHLKPNLLIYQIINRPVRDGFTRENFLVTPKMSTYLVAFHISDLKLAKESDANNKSLPHIKMYTQPGYENMTK